MAVGKYRNEDLSVFFFIKGIDIGNGQSLGSFAKIVDSYPYTEIEDGILIPPSVSVEAKLSTEHGGELGASWIRRDWAIDFFAVNDTQRDEVADIIYQALNNSFPIRDYSNGFRKDTGQSLAGTDLRIIEYVTPEERSIKPAYNFSKYQKVRYWRVTVSFSTVSTAAS
jgi:hypothetical protein